MFVKVIALLVVVVLAEASEHMVGAPHDADINDQEVQGALQFAIAEHNKASNDIYVSQVSRVIRAQQQVVAGMEYVFEIEMVRTTCKKSDEEVKDVCPIMDGAPAKQCTISVWSRPWMNLMEIVENTC